MPITLAELAKLVEGRLQGDGTLTILGAATLDLAASDQITLADNEDRYSEFIKSPAAAAVVLHEVGVIGKPTIVVEDVHQAFAKIVAYFRPQRARQTVGISPAAHISPSAQLAEGVEVHPGATIGDEVAIGPGTVIHANACLMAGCRIGAEVTIFPNAVLYEDTVVGERSIIHAGAVIGAYGFGYREQEGQHLLSAQLGNVEIGSDVEVGACATIDRGTYGRTLIGDGTKIDNLVQIAHNCRLGKHNLICGQVGIAGSTTTGDYVVMAGQVGVRDHVHIGERAVLCSKAGVSNNVDEGEVVLGQPATPLKKQKLQMAAISKLPEMRKEFRTLQRQLQLLEEKLQKASNQPGDQAA